MTAGARHIQAVNLTADLPYNAQDGDLCYDRETEVLNIWRNGGWESVATAPGDVLAVMTYDYDKQQDILNIPETYTQLNNFTSPSRPAGIYEVGMSFTWDFTLVSKSAYFRWSTDGGSTWNEFISEPKDVQDKMAMYYQYPFNHPGGQMNIITQMRKEDATGTLNVTFSDVWFRRVA